MLSIINVIFCIKPVQDNKHLVNAVAIDGVVLQHQGISSHSVQYTPTRFQLLTG